MQSAEWMKENAAEHSVLGGVVHEPVMNVLHESASDQHARRRSNPHTATSAIAPGVGTL